MTLVMDHKDGLTLRVIIQSRSSKNMIAGRHNDSLKIKLTAPPVDGAANSMCIKFLAKSFNVPKSSIEIISGHTARNKKIFIQAGNTQEKETLRNRIEALL